MEENTFSTAPVAESTPVAHPELEVNLAAKTYLKTAAGWAQFMAIINFIGLGFIVIVGLVMFAFAGTFASLDSELSSFGAVPFTLIGLLYAALGIVAFFPAYYLYKFARITPEAILHTDSENLSEGFRFMKSYWKFQGILTIIMLALCILVVPISIFSAASLAML